MNRNCSPMVEKILSYGLKVLIYHGDKDYICNWVGGLSWVENLNWEFSKEFKETQFERKFGGEYKQVNNLEFFRIYEAGHMVPLDQPEVALNMLNKFIGV